MRRIVVWLSLIVCWALPTFAHAQSTSTNPFMQIKSIAWSPDGTQIAATFGDSSVKVWNFTADPELAAPLLTFHPLVAEQLGWTPNGQFLVVSGTNVTQDQVVQTQATEWNASTGQLAQTLFNYQLSSSFAFSPYDYVNHPTISFDPTYTRAAFSFKSRIVSLSDGTSVIFVGDQGDPPQSIYQIAWSPDDSRMAVVYGTEDTYSIQTFDLASTHLINTMDGQDYGVTSLQWNSDTTRIAVASTWYDMTSPSANVAIYTVASGKDYLTQADQTWNFDNTGAAAISWRPHENQIAIASASGIQIFDISSAKPLTSITAQVATALSWSPDGKHLAGGLMDGTVHVWSVP